MEGAQVEQAAIAVRVGLFVERPVYLHEGIFGSAIVFGVVADTMYIVCVVIEWSLRIVLEVVVIAGLRQFFWWWYVVWHWRGLRSCPDCIVD
jgi:hypothetical protein